MCSHGYWALVILYVVMWLFFITSVVILSCTFSRLGWSLISHFSFWFSVGATINERLSKDLQAVTGCSSIHIDLPSYEHSWSNNELSSLLLGQRCTSLLHTSVAKLKHRNWRAKSYTATNGSYWLISPDSHLIFWLLQQRSQNVMQIPRETEAHTCIKVGWYVNR